MRVILAGLLVFFALFAGVSFVYWLSPDPPLWVAMPLILFIFFGSIFLSLILFNRSNVRYSSAEDQAKRLRELEITGQLIEQEFFAKRAFQVEEFEDEGSHYFLELIDGKVLFLTGQYLYDYEGPPCRFPCERFVLSRHREGGWAAFIKCSDKRLELDGVAPYFIGEDYEKNVPQDGEILENTTYDQAFSRWMNRERKPF